VLPNASTSPGNIHACGGNIAGEHGRQIKYIFFAAFVDFASVDVTVVSSLKRFKKSFFYFTYFKEFKNAKII